MDGLIHRSSDRILQTCTNLLESQLGVACGAGKTVDTPGLVQGRHH